MANNIVAGEWDWMNRLPGAQPGMGFPSPAPSAQPGGLQRVLGGLLGTPGGAYGGLLGEGDKKAAQQQALLALSTQLLQAGGPSDTRVSFGQALGSGLAAAHGAQRQYGQDALQAMLLRTKLQKPGAKKYHNVSPGGAIVDPETGQVVYSNPTAAKQGPSNVQEWEYFSKLPVEDQKRFLELKRNQNALQLVDIAGGKSIFNKASGAIAPVSTADQEASAAGQIAGATAGAKVTGEQTAQAQIDLPRVSDNAKQALKTLDEFEKHPGFQYVFGIESPAPTIPGSKQAGALTYYDQIKGKTFLEAFNSLKGAGQITEIEGTKATDAIGRLNRAQSDSDAKKALVDLREVISSGLSRAEKKAGVSQKRRYNPQTGKIE